jgi:hypothetical protein
MTTVGRDGATVAHPAHTFILRVGALARSLLEHADGLAVGVLAVVSIIAALTFKDYGLGWDDYTHSQMGELLLSLYGSGFKDQRALSFVNLYMYGGGFDMIAALAARILPFDLFETRRLVSALVGIAGLIVTWRTARRLGGPLAGLLALTLLATCPLYYGHMYMNAKDAPFATAMALLTYSVVRLLQEYPRPRPSSIAWFGLGLGLSVGSRVLGDLAAISAFGALAFMLGAEWRRLGRNAAAQRTGRFILVLLPGVVLAYLIMGLVWPWSVLTPYNPIRALQYFSHFFEVPWRELFDGVRIPTVDMPRSYVPTLLAVQLPVLFLILSLAGIAGAIVACTRSENSISLRAGLVYVMLAALVPPAITVLERPAMYNGLRHFVFILPALAVLGGLAAAYTARKLTTHGPLIGAAATLFVLGLIFPVTDMVRLHPYEYAFYNVFIGGSAGARPLYMLDYWGLSFKQAAAELRQQLQEHNESPPQGGQWKVAVCGPHPPAHVALGPQFDLTWDPKGADFALMLGEFYCAQYDAPVLVEIKRDGVVFARVYDIRGRHVSNIFTTPPAGQ